jgi:hypothetical protein
VGRPGIIPLAGFLPSYGGTGLSYARKMSERAVKEALMSQLENSGIPLEEAVEWLWDDFGKRVQKSWKAVRRAVLGDQDITPQDIAVFMIENDVQPEEGAWDVLPRRGLRAGGDRGED